MTFIRTYIDSRGLISEQTDTQPTYTLEIRGPVSTSVNGGSQQKPYTYVVGNALAGDNSYNCDFLDPGDGTGLERALAAARISSSIYIKPGQINLNQDLIGLPLTLSQSCNLIGAGVNLTKIQINSGSSTKHQTFISCSVSSSMENFTIQIPEANASLPSSTALYMCNMDYSTKIKNVNVQFVSDSASRKLSRLFVWSNGTGDFGQSKAENINLDSTKAIQGSAIIMYLFLLENTNNLYIEPREPFVLENINVNNNPNINGRRVMWQTIYGSNFLKINVANVNLKNVLNGFATGLFSITMSNGNYRGPQVSNLFIDNTDANYAPNAYNGAIIQLTNAGLIASSASIYGTTFNNINLFQGGGAAAGTRAVGVDVQTGSLSLVDLKISNCFATGSSAYTVQLTTANSGSIIRGSITGCTNTGGIILTPATGGTIKDITINGCTSGPITLSNTDVSGTVVVGNRITTYTDNGTNTLGGATLNRIG